MKKLISIILALLFMITLFAGCTVNIPVPSASKTTAGASASTAKGSSPAKSTTSAPATNATAPKSPADSYGLYTEAKSAAYDKVSKKMEDNSELALSAGMTILAVATVDLSMLGLTAMSPETSQVAGMLGIIGLKDAKVDISGNKYTLTYADQEGNKIQQICEYDPATDSVASTVTDAAGKQTFFFEYVKTGNGYASQYYAPGENSGLITCFFNDDMAAFGVCSSNAAPQSIFKKTGVTSDIVKNNELYMIMQGDKLTVTENGKETTY